jgi:hypothetical protein
MKVACFSESSVDFQETKWRYVLEERIIHNHRSENLKYYIPTVVGIYSAAKETPFCTEIQDPHRHLLFEPSGSSYITKM